MKQIIVCMGLLSMMACNREDVNEPNEEEVINRVELQVKSFTGGLDTTFVFNDPDGDGGIVPSINTIVLPQNDSFMVSVMFLNTTVTPNEDITEEVEEEGDAHRLFFEPSNAALLQVTDLSKDDDGKLLGLVSTWRTGGPGTGTVRVSLRHYGGTPPDKQDADLVTSTKAETDVQITFPVTIQ